MKITDTMVLALLKKGVAYQINNMDMEFETEYPIGILLGDENAPALKMKCTCKMESFKLEIADNE